MLQQSELWLEKKVVERVEDPHSPGCYGGFLVVPRKELDSMKSILDWFQWNWYITKETEKVRQLLGQGELLTSSTYDLKWMETRASGPQERGWHGNILELIAAEGLSITDQASIEQAVLFLWWMFLQQ